AQLPFLRSPNRPARRFDQAILNWPKPSHLSQHRRAFRKPCPPRPALLLRRSRRPAGPRAAARKRKPRKRRSWKTWFAKLPSNERRKRRRPAHYHLMVKEEFRPRPRPATINCRRSNSLTNRRCAASKLTTNCSAWQRSWPRNVASSTSLAK